MSACMSAHCRFLKKIAAFRIPALVDHTCGDVPIFESGAIMWWLASRDPEAKLFPKDPIKQAEVMSWLMFQMVIFSSHILIADWNPHIRLWYRKSHILLCCMTAGRSGPNARPSQPLPEICACQDRVRH